MKIIVEKEMLEQVLEALELRRNQGVSITYNTMAEASISTLRTALETAEKADPVAWQVTRNLADDPYNRIPWLTSSKPLEVQPGTSVVPLYAAPVAQESVTWGIDCGTGDLSRSSIIKKLPNGDLEVVACEYASAPVASSGEITPFNELNAASNRRADGSFRASSEGVKPWPGLVVQDLGFSRINGKNIPTVVLSFAEEDWATRDAFADAMEGASHAQTKRI